jgi:hypothetical protein
LISGQSGSKLGSSPSTTRVHSWPQTSPLAACERSSSHSNADPAEAIAHAERIEDVLAQAGLQLEQVHHGDGVASWAVNRRALERGHGIRTGLEDTPVLADGRPALGNAELVTEAATLIDEIHR